MDRDQLRLSMVNQELAETYEHIDRQHAQIKWLVQTYLALLFGFFSLSGYLAQKDATSLSAAMGVGSTVAVFAFGWLSIAIVAHKFANLMMLHKHLSIFTGSRLSILNEGDRPSAYYFPKAPETVYVPGLLSYVPELFTLLNFAVIFGGIWFHMGRLVGVHTGAVVALAVSAVVGAFYPRSCVNFHKHIKAADRARSIPDKRRCERIFERSRERETHKKNALRTICKTASFITAALLVILSVAVMTSEQEEAKQNLLGGAFVAFLVYVGSRYGLEVAHGYRNLLGDASECE